MKQTTNMIENYFNGYAASVAQSRALISVEDGLKPSLRQVLYANYTDKYVGKKKKAKFLKLIGSASRFAWHGDASTYGMMIRAAKPFAMRYPLYGAQGSYGTLMDSENHASARYVEGYISSVGEQLFNFIGEETIDSWRDNYDNTEQFPEVLPSVGFWNLCNGTLGIGVGLSSSIPQFNLVEMNTALIAMLKKESYTLPLPDFATGGVLLNSSEVRESLLNGQGASCKLRAKMSYDEKTRTFTVYEIPYATYTNTICEQLENLMEDSDCPIETFIDVTGEAPNIQITIKKGATPSEVQEYIFSKTSLQNHYGINLTMLENGRFPKVFSLPEAMQAHLDHEQKIYYKAFTYQLGIVQKRLHILEGYILACAHIEEVIKAIKESHSRQEAQKELTKRFELDNVQADAVLKLTLARIAALEVEKFITEREELTKKALQLTEILESDELLNEEIIKGLRKVIQQFGDKRRTELLDIEEEAANKVYYFTEDGRVGLSTPKKGAVIGTLPAGQGYLVVTEKGIVYRSKEQPKRLKKVFNIEDGDRAMKVFPDREDYFLTIVNDEKKFRCVAISGLNKIRTTLALSNLKEIYITKERTKKATYKEMVK